MLPRDCDAGLAINDHLDAPPAPEAAYTIVHGMTLAQAHEILADACPGCKHYVEATQWQSANGKVDRVTYSAVVYPGGNSGLKSAGEHLACTLLEAVRGCIDDAIRKGLCGENKRVKVIDPARAALLGD